METKNHGLIFDMLGYHLKTKKTIQMSFQNLMLYRTRNHRSEKMRIHCKRKSHTFLLFSCFWSTRCVHTSCLFPSKKSIFEILKTQSESHFFAHQTKTQTGMRLGIPVLPQLPVSVQTYKRKPTLVVRLISSVSIHMCVLGVKKLVPSTSRKFVFEQKNLPNLFFTLLSPYLIGKSSDYQDQMCQ